MFVNSFDSFMAFNSRSKNSGQYEKSEKLAFCHHSVLEEIRCDLSDCKKKGKIEVLGFLQLGADYLLEFFAPILCFLSPEL